MTAWLICLFVLVGAWIRIGDRPARLLLAPLLLAMIVGIVLRFAL